jgi:hypothetical protein
VLGDTLGRTLGNEVLGISTDCTLGRSLGEKVGNEVLGISLDNIETLGYVVGSDDGVWLGALLAEVFGDTLGRAIGNKVLGIKLDCTIGRSLGEKVGNEVLGISLGNIESLGYVLGSADGI